MNQNHLPNDDRTGRRVKSTDSYRLEIGKILGYKIWGSQKQYLVDFGSKRPSFISREDIKLLPSLYEELCSNEDKSEDYRLKLWASVLKTENIGTMSLSKMTLDILPHQLEMAHRALETPADGFLIADGVGLGKTIEAGMTIQSMIYRGEVDDVLIISPAKLMRQWKEQMLNKFNMFFDTIGGDYDNHEHDSRAFWKNRSKVIASMETLKQDTHKSGLISSGKRWDLVVVDEAHKLSSYEEGSSSYNDKKTLNYELLEDLRPVTDFFLFLSATPHQGDQPRFLRLLKLLDQDYIEEDFGDKISVKDDKDINDMIARNDKYEVEDLDGGPIFKGHVTEHKKFEPEEEYLDFLDDLKEFIKKDLVFFLDDGRGKGFLKSTLLKLANSSPKAIKHTLENRYGDFSSDIEDGRFEGEIEEKDAIEQIKDIKKESEEKVEDLLSVLRDIETMGRLEVLMDIIEDKIIGEDEKLLIFTEYRKTQQHIKEHLSDIFGESEVEILNGDMGTFKKYKAIKKFDEEAKFLVSTEAGGEGLDMHQQCHIMVNFDIPWNPMRLHQRTGRLDRYGQKEEVLRYDIIAEETIDDKISEYLEDKMKVIKNSLSDLEGGSIEDLGEKVLGRIEIDEEDMSDYYLDDDEDAKKRMDERIDEEIENTIEGEEILKSLRTIAPEDYTMEETAYGLDSLRDFMKVYLDDHGEGFKEEDGKIIFEIPEEIKDLEFYEGESLDMVNLRVTFDRDLAQEEKDLRLLGFGDPFMDAIVDRNIYRVEEGETGSIEIFTDEDRLIGKEGILASFIVRNEVNEKLRFDGGEFYFAEWMGESFGKLHHEDDLTDIIVKNIIEGGYGTLESVPTCLDKDMVDEVLDRMERGIRRIDRGGRLGGTMISSLGWVKFKEE